MTDISKLASIPGMSLLNSCISFFDEETGTNTTPTTTQNDTGASIAMAAVTLTVIGAIFAYKKIQECKEEHEKKEIKAIIDIYEENLKVISVSGLGTVKGFPAPFEKMKDKYQSMHFTPSQVAAMGENYPDVDVPIQLYQQFIRDAINQLKEYYFTRIEYGKNESKQNDITAGVIYYLLYLLENKVFNLEGYNFDRACLEGICKFINAYASHYGAKSQHFDRLSEAHSSLLNAQAFLKKHQEILSLRETVSQLNTSCSRYGDMLMRKFLPMVIPHEYTQLSDTVITRALKEGMLRRHFIKTQIWGFEVRSNPEVELPKSIFKDWIQDLAGLYLSTFSVISHKDIEGEEPKNIFNSDFFTVLEKAKISLEKFMLKPTTEEKEAKLVKDTLADIKEVFQHSGNFISKKYNSKKKRFDVISDEKELVDRSLIMANFAQLTHELLTMRYLASSLLQSVRKLGEIYVTNPKNFRKIFTVLRLLCERIVADAKALSNAFTTLQQANQGHMQEKDKEAFPAEVINILDNLSADISNYTQQIMKCRKDAKIAVELGVAETKESVALEMQEVVAYISKIYHLDSRRKSKPIELAPHKEKKSNKEKRKSSSNSLSSDIKETMIPSPSSSVVTEPKTKKEKDLLAVLKELNEGIKQQILLIQKKELAAAAKYKDMYKALTALQDKAERLHNETEKSEERTIKAEQNLKLTISLFKQTSSFFKQSTGDRLSSAKEFAEGVHNKLNSDNNEFIDEHKRVVSRFVADNICKHGIFGICSTESRRKYNAFDEACKNMSLS